MNELGKSERFRNLGVPARVVIYVVNALLMVALIAALVVIVPMGIMIFLYAVGAIGKGGGTALVIMFTLALWFLASYYCFIGVIVMAAWKKRWSWIMQFLPFVTAAVFYSLMMMAAHWQARTN